MNSNLDAEYSEAIVRWCNAWMDATGINDWDKAIEAYYNKYHTPNLA